MPITIGSPRGEAGVDSLYNTEEKIFEDIRANPGRRPSCSSTPSRSRVRCRW